MVYQNVTPKLYQIAHPRTPYMVVFTDPAGKRVRRYFKRHQEAATYHRELAAKAKMHGTVGLVMDAEMRAPMLGSIFDPTFKRWLGCRVFFGALGTSMSAGVIRAAGRHGELRSLIRVYY